MPIGYGEPSRRKRRKEENIVRGKEKDGCSERCCGKFGDWILRHEDVDSGNGVHEASTSVVRRKSARPSMYKVLDIDHGSGESNEGPDSDSKLQDGGVVVTKQAL